MMRLQRRRSLGPAQVPLSIWRVKTRRRRHIVLQSSSQDSSGYRGKLDQESSTMHECILTIPAQASAQGGETRLGAGNSDIWEHVYKVAHQPRVVGLGV